MPDPLLAMNFAIINGQRVPVGNDQEFDIREETDADFDLKEEPNLDSGPINQVETQPEQQEGIISKLLKPIVDVSPGTRDAMHQFTEPGLNESVWGARAKGFIGGSMEALLDTILSESSPLSIILGGAGAGETIAAKAGMPAVEKLLKIPSRAAGVGMGAHGISRMGTDESLSENLGGFTEAALGGLAVKGPKSRNIKLEKFIDSPIPALKKPLQLGTGARFIAGEAGVADVNTPYKMDIGAVNPSMMGEGETGTILPRELGEIIDVPPDLAARRGITLGRPITLEQLNQLIDDGMGPIISSDLIKTWADELGIDSNKYPDIRELRRKVVSVAKQLAYEKSIDSFRGRLNHLGSDETGAIGKLNIDPKTKDYFAGKNELAPGATNTVEEVEAARDRAAGRRTGSFEERLNTPIKPEEAKFVYDWRARLQNLLKDETGAVGKLSGERARDEFWDALEAAIPIREEQEALYSQERGKRFSKASKVKTPGFAGVYERLGKLKGELPKVDFEPLTNLHASTKASLVKQIFDSNLKQGEKIRAAVGLGKLLGESDKGFEVPQRGEIALLGQVFGADFSSKLEMMHSGLPITKKALNEVANFTKSIMASIDLSAPLRQGLPLIHKAAFWRGLGPMIKYAANPEFYEGTMRAIQERPKFEIGEKAGLKFTALGEDLFNREEPFMSRLAEKIPGVPASERAYVGFLNKLRADTFDKLIDYANQMGQKTHDIIKIKVRRKQPDGKMRTVVEEKIIPTQVSKDIARFVNNATGRGSLGRFEKNALELNYALFSPRLLTSRLTMLNPLYYASLSPIARKEALKSLFAVAAAGGTVSLLGSLAGGEVETDPTSSDFMKVKIGNTRLDPYGGFQQYIVAASKLIAQSAKSSTTGKETKFGSSYVAPTSYSVLDNLRRSKMAPLASFAEDMLRSKDMTGKPINMTQEIASRVVPLFVQDIVSLATENPELLPGIAQLVSGQNLHPENLPLAIPAGLGMGVQTFENKPTSKNQLKPLKPVSGGLRPLAR